MNTLSIILPVYNEKETLPQVLDEWKGELSKNNISYTMVICEDGSTDGTKELLKKLQKPYALLLNQTKRRRGYGAAVLDGIAQAPASYILCVDSDGQCDPKDFITFWKSRDKADIIVGWRKKRADSLPRKLYSLCFKLFFILLFGKVTRDPSNPFVLFKKRTILPYISYLTYLQEGFWWGFTATCIKKRLSIHQIPIHHRQRLEGNTKVYKISRIPSIAMRNLWALIKLRFA